jgi:hypothetical protein
MPDPLFKGTAAENLWWAESECVCTSIEFPVQSTRTVDPDCSPPPTILRLAREKKLSDDSAMNI